MKIIDVDSSLGNPVVTTKNMGVGNQINNKKCKNVNFY